MSFAKNVEEDQTKLPLMDVGLIGVRIGKFCAQIVLGIRTFIFVKSEQRKSQPDSYLIVISGIFCVGYEEKIGS